MITVFHLVAAGTEGRSPAALAAWLATPRPPVDTLETVVAVEPMTPRVDDTASRPDWVFGTNFPYLGMVELSFADYGRWVAAEPEVREFYSRELGGLTDPEASLAVATRGNVVVAGPDAWGASPTVKATFFARRRPGLDRAEFGSHWRDIHAPIVPQTPHLVRYVQGHVVDEEYAAGAEPPFDGVAQLWWPTLDAMGEAMASHTMQVTQPQDAVQFVDLDAQFGFVGVERTLDWA